MPTENNQLQNPSEIAFIDQVNLVHTALFGWPCDELTPLEYYMDAWNIHEVGLRILNSDRFRWDIRAKVGLWPHDKWVMTVYKGLKIWVNLFDGFVSFGVLHGNWEDQEVQFMLSCLKPGDAMIDCGANVGVYALQAATVVGETGQVYAFEPNKQVFDMLAQSVKDNGLESRISLYNQGLGARQGEGSFHLNGHMTNPGSSFISVGNSGDPIKIMPIDAIDYRQCVRFIKIDVEGFEPHVIVGATETLKKHRPIILTEFFPRSLREVGGMNGAAYIEMLEKRGYAMTVFSEAEEHTQRVSKETAGQFDEIVEPINLICRPRM